LVQALECGERGRGREVAQRLSLPLGHPVRVLRGYEWLASLKFSPQVPRPAHQQADAEDQRVFKKSSRQLSR
jgi:hypothetical protein